MSRPDNLQTSHADEERRWRYVVLHHTSHGEPHFDLMLERSVGDLWTMRTADWPLMEGTALTPLPPHRRIYLDYEGPVSGGRGEVRRIAAGMWRRVRLGSPDHDPVEAVVFDEADEAWVLGERAERLPYPFDGEAAG